MPKLLLACASLFATLSLPTAAHAALQCVPYAREVSGVAIHGDAHTWWRQADGVYERGNAPRPNAVMVFRSSRAMPLGHVAVVHTVVDARHVLLDHANWSRPGMIEHQAMAEDVSEAGDWSEVRVWFDRTQSLGARVNPVFGFIYNGPDTPDMPTPATPTIQLPQFGPALQVASAEAGTQLALAGG